MALGTVVLFTLAFVAAATRQRDAARNTLSPIPKEGVGLGQAQRSQRFQRVLPSEFTSAVPHGSARRKQ